jgi:hypothetical protein
VWCLLAAVLAHESAHTTPNTERDALMAEAAQLRRCISSGHLFPDEQWNPLISITSSTRRAPVPDARWRTRTPTHA